MSDIIIDIHHLSTYFGQVCIHHNVNLAIKRGEILAVVGGSGSGKTTLLRNILMLQRPTSGSIKIFGEEVTKAHVDLMKIRRQIGVMFQQGALFTSLTVVQNIAFPLSLHTDLPKETIEEIALLKLGMVGLDAKSANKYPAELSGGMIKRVAVARAIAMDPQLLFLDEPTAGLDPHSANALDELIVDLKSVLGLTIVLVTHDLDTLWRVADRVAFLGEKQVLAVDTMKNLTQHDHPLIKQYFSGARARLANEANHTTEEG